MNYENTLGGKIRCARKAKGLKQSDVSANLNVRNTAISSWEKNQSKPDLQNIEALCKILDVSPNYFFNVDIEEKMTLEELELIRTYRKLDERGKYIIKGIIQIL